MGVRRVPVSDERPAPFGGRHLPSAEMRTSESERRAQMAAPLRDAFPLPPTDARFAEMLEKLRDAGRPAGPEPEGWDLGPA